MRIPKWLDVFITEDAFTLSPEQLEKLNVNSREEFFWKYIVINVLKPKPPQYSNFVTSEDDFFVTSDGQHFQAKTY